MWMCGCMWRWWDAGVDGVRQRRGFGSLGVSVTLVMLIHLHQVLSSRVSLRVGQQTQRV